MKINLTPFTAFLRPLYTESGRSGRSKDRQLSTLTRRSVYMNGPSCERCLQIIINPTQILTE